MKIILFAIPLVFALSACTKNSDECTEKDQMKCPVGSKERKAAQMKRLIGPAAEPEKK